MTKHSCITNTTLDMNTSPTIVRSTINQCAFNSLSPADTIQRSSLNGVTITGDWVTQNPPPTPAVGPTPYRSITCIVRSKVTSSVLSHVSTRRSDITNSTVENVGSARCLTVKDSQLADLRSANRCSIKGSVVGGNSGLKRSEVQDSTISEESFLRRSTVSRSRVAHSRVNRSTLTDCDVGNCVLIRSSFKGMVLRNGVWKNGRLIGRMGDSEVVAIGGDGKAMAKFDTGKILTKSAQAWADSDSNSESSDEESLELKGEARDLNRDHDLPPPYTP